MELLEYIGIIKKRIWMIAVITIVCALLSAVYSIFFITPAYQAKTTLIIGRTPVSEGDKVQYNDILMYQKLVKTYGELAKSRLVAQGTIESLGLDMAPERLQGGLTVTPKGDTQILEIVLQHENPETAMVAVNALAEVFIEKVREFMNSEDVKVMDTARLPIVPAKPRVFLNIVIALFVGLMGSLGLAFLLEYLDNTIKTEEDVAKHMGISVLASIPFAKDI